MVEREWRRELRGSRVWRVPVMTTEEAVRWNAAKRYVQPRADRRSIGRYGELLSGRFLRFEGATRRRFLHPLLADAAWLDGFAEAARRGIESVCSQWLD